MNNWLIGCLRAGVVLMLAGAIGLVVCLWPPAIFSVLFAVVFIVLAYLLRP